MPDDASDERERLIHDLEVHQAELEAQNRQLRETQDMLEQSRARYADLYDFAPFAYCTFDSDGVIREINLAGATLLGAARARLIGKPFLACAAVTDTLAFVNHLNQCLASRDPCTTELTLLPLKREPIVLQVVSAPFFRKGGALAGCRSALTDISVRKKAEDALRLAIRMREDFLAIVSHELRNPLSTILLAAELLLKLPLAPEGQQIASRHLDSILRSAKRMTRLVTDLLDLSSMEAGHLSMQRGIHDLDDIVGAALAIVQPAASEKSIRLERILPSGPLPTDCDRERIIQVLLNLVGNAIKFTPEGGTIRVEARAVADKVLCAVRDTGIGITSEEKLHLFKPYWQAESRNHHHGAGLGLSIAKGIVEFHGGKLWLDAGPGPGSTFTFTLSAAAAGARPLTRAPTPGAAPPLRELTPGKTVPAAEQTTVLLVDDDADTRSALSELLVGVGYQVVTAGNGQEALVLVRQMDPRPAVILLDLVMPVMDGWTFLAERALDARIAGTPVILISGQTDAHKMASEYGLTGSVEKPIAIETLLRALQQVGRSPGGIDVDITRAG